MRRALLLLVVAACGHRTERARDAGPAAPPDAHVPMLVRHGFCAPMKTGPIGGPVSQQVAVGWNGQRIEIPYDPAAGGYLCGLVIYPAADTHDMFPISIEGATQPGPDLHAFVPGAPTNLFVTFPVVDDLYARELAALAENLRPLTGGRRKAACETALARTPPGVAALTKRATEQIQHFLDTGDPPESSPDGGSAELLLMQLQAIRTLCQ